MRGELTVPLFGQLAIAKGFINPQQLELSLQEQQRLHREGIQIPLGQILLRNQWIHWDQFLEILQIQGRTVLYCATCGRVYSVKEFKELEGYICRACSAPLTPEVRVDVRSLPRHEENPSSTAEAGQYISKYELLGEIGHGAMSTVYLARDILLHRTVALKVLRLEGAETTFVQRLYHEARAAGRLRHPNIAAVYDVGSQNTLYFIAMEYVEGENFGDLIRQRRLDQHRLIQILEEISRAIHFAHEHGVIHRDVKPDNVLIDSQQRPIITDFGLAKTIDSATLLTKTGTAIGTPAYMPPEQVAGKLNQIDERSDVYSLGVILYQILTGALPYEAASVVELYKKILEEEPVRPRTRVAHLDPQIEAVCMKAIEKEKLHRYQSAKEFADDLHRYLEGEPVTARSSSIATRIWKRLRYRKRVLLPVAVIALLALILLGIQTWVFIQKEISLGYAQRYLRAAEERLSYLSRLTMTRMSSPQEKERVLNEILTYADMALQYDPKLLDALIITGIVNYRQHKLERAEEILTEALRINPDHPRALFYRGVSYLSRTLLTMKRYPPIFMGPEVILPKCVDTPESTRWRRLAIRDLSRVRITARDRFIKMLASAYIYYLQGQLKKAIRYLSEYLKRYRIEYRPYVMRGDGYYLLHQFQEAVKDFDRALELAPREADIYKRRFYALLAMGKFERALKDYKQYTQLIEHEPPVTKLAYIYVIARLGDLDRALRLINELIKEDQTNAELYSNRASLKLAKGNIKGALKDYTQAIRLSPKNPIYYIYRAGLWFQRRKIKKALEDCQEAIRLDPNHPGIYMAYTNLGCIYSKMGKSEQAEDCFKKAIELNPRGVLAYVNLGRHYLSRGQVKQAIKAYTKAIRVQPRFVDAYLGRGGIYYQQGRYKKALRDWKKAIELDPKIEPRIRVLLQDARKRALKPL